ncbi:cytochrome P450 [Armillaria solidipes]|uniref:Cytochrome P450 n=1 Tax=Armillaria solidipes TaxID=1076256 RepID=A0A2H3BBE4_9AGAR|nr:cytochrome P450 [Armillaria solidipes]
MLVLCTLSIIAVLSFAKLFYRLNRAKRRQYPGPTPWPVIGNIFPTTRIWEAFANLRPTYGDTFSLTIAGTPIIVLNSAEMGRELLENRSAKYWKRPLPKMIELAGMERGVVFQPDATRLRKSRALIHNAINPRSIPHIRNVLDQHIHMFLHHVLASPEEFMDHLHNTITAIMLLLSHGYTVSGPNDLFLKMAKETVQNFARASDISQFAVEWIPFLSWVPFMPFKSLAKSWLNQYTMLVDDGLKMVNAAMDRGNASYSLLAEAIQSKDKDVDIVDIAKFAAAEVFTDDYSNAEEQTISTMNSFILAMVLHPDVQHRAHAELDTTIGCGNFPTYEDKQNLPFINAILKETLRRYTPIPLVHRKPSTDDTVHDFFIAKDTMVLVNFWGMLNDPLTYPDPASFRPERWTCDDTTSIDPLKVVFGFGRRLCPGRLLAEDLLFMMISSTLALFEISPPTNEAGQHVYPTGEYSDGGMMFVAPLPFKCTFKVRSKELAATVSALG